jgi:UDP-glucose 4-epimerase
MPRVLITGGGGFIGQGVARAYAADGWSVVITDRECDVRNPWEIEGAIREHRPDLVVHLAGVLGTHELFDRVGEAIDVNVKGTANVLEACRKWEARYVGVTMPPVFPSIYTATKIAASKLATAYHHTYGLPVSHVQAFNAFGPGQAHGLNHPQKILPTFATEAWAGRPIPIWGDGLQGVDLIDVDELGQVFRAAGDHGDDWIVDGGTGRSFTVLEVAEMVLDVTGSTAGVQHLPMRRGEIATKIIAEGQGWDRLARPPQFTLAQLERCVHAYRPASR